MRKLHFEKLTSLGTGASFEDHLKAWNTELNRLKSNGAMVAADCVTSKRADFTKYLPPELLKAWKNGNRIIGQLYNSKKDSKLLKLVAEIDYRVSKVLNHKYDISDYIRKVNETVGDLWLEAAYNIESMTTEESKRRQLIEEAKRRIAYFSAAIELHEMRAAARRARLNDPPTDADIKEYIAKTHEPDPPPLPPKFDENEDDDSDDNDGSGFNNTRLR